MGRGTPMPGPRLNGGPHDARGTVAALTMGQQRDNLPPEVTRFIGRRREVPAIIAAIDQYRLVTLRGAGGVGKTRLALRVAREIRDTLADGSWLVELSALRYYELLPGAVAAALGLPGEAGGALLGAAAGRGGGRARAAGRGARPPDRVAGSEPRRAGAAAGARHLRAPGRGLRQPRLHAAGSRARAAHPHHQPGAAG